MRDSEEGSVLKGHLGFLYLAVRAFIMSHNHSSETILHTHTNRHKQIELQFNRKQ